MSESCLPRFLSCLIPVGADSSWEGPVNHSRWFNPSTAFELGTQKRMIRKTVDLFIHSGLIKSTRLHDKK